MVVLSIILLLVGCLFIYGAGQEAGGELAGKWKRQACWAGLGAVCFLVVCCMDYRFLGRWSWLLYLLAVVLLALIYSPIGYEINYARSWLQLPVAGIRIQPAEMAKPATLLLTAWLLSRPLVRAHGGLFVVPVLLVVVTPVVLICLQPDYGTALVFVPVLLCVFFVSGIPWKWLAAGGAAAVLIAALAYRSLDDSSYKKERIDTFIHPSQDVTVTGWNAHQSLLAVGSGGVWGKGYMKGTQHVLGFLPRAVAPTDFIFSVVAEEAGFIGAGAVVCAFMGLILCCLRVATLAPDEFGAYLAVGVGGLLFAHAYTNIGMTIQAAPIVGIPLPFVSYGGSFILSTMICTGLVQSVYVRRGSGFREEDP